MFVFTTTLQLLCSACQLHSCTVVLIVMVVLCMLFTQCMSLTCCMQVRVASEIAHVLSLPRRQLDGFLGAVGSGLASRGQVLAALRQCRSLQVGAMISSWLAMVSGGGASCSKRSRRCWTRLRCWHSWITPVLPLAVILSLAVVGADCARRCNCKQVLPVNTPHFVWHRHHHCSWLQRTAVSHCRGCARRS